MHIWYRRPLFAVCTAFMAAAGIGWLTAGASGDARRLPALCFLAAALLCAAAALALSIPVRQERTGSRCARMRRLSVYLAVLCASAALALNLSGAYFSRCAALSARALSPESDGPEAGDAAAGADDPAPTARPVTVEGTVTACRGAGGQLSSFELTVRTLNGETVGSALAPCRVVLTCFYPADLRPGYDILLTAQPVPLREEAGDTDTLRRLTGDGFVFAMHSFDESDWRQTAGRTRTLAARMSAARRTASARLQTLVGKAAGGIPSALLLGDRAPLDGSVRRDFSRAGVSHLLAVSGLHVSLLFGMLMLLFRLLRVPRRISLLLVSVSAWAYLFLIGFPPSAVRAVIMLSFVCVGGLLSARSDPLTALGTAGMLILACSPSAVCDDGFWMSFSAAFGLLTVLPVCTVVRSAAGKLQADGRGAVRKTVVGLLTGVAAMSCSLWITGQSVGRFSLASPFATLLLTPLCAAVLILSLLTLLLFGTSAASAVLAPALRAVCRAMIALAGWFGRPSWVVVSLRHPAVLPVTAVMMLLLLLLLGAKLSAKARPAVLLPLVCGWLTLGIILSGAACRDRDMVTLSCLAPSSVSDELVLTNRGCAVIVDVSDGSHAALYAAADAAEDAGATEVTALILTHYHSRHPGALSKLLASEPVDTLLLPVPEDADDYYLMLSCLSAADHAGTKVSLYSPGQALSVFGGTTITVERARIDRSVQPIVIVRADIGTDTVTYLGGAVFESPLADKASAAFAGGTAVFCGCHGPALHEDFAPSVGSRLSLVCFADPADAAHAAGIGDRAVCRESVTIRLHMGGERRLAEASGSAPAP